MLLTLAWEWHAQSNSGLCATFRDATVKDNSDERSGRSRQRGLFGERRLYRNRAKSARLLGREMGSSRTTDVQPVDAATEVGQVPALKLSSSQGRVQTECTRYAEPLPSFGATRRVRQRTENSVRYNYLGVRECPQKCAGSSAPTERASPVDPHVAIH